MVGKDIKKLQELIDSLEKVKQEEDKKKLEQEKTSQNSAEQVKEDEKENTTNMNTKVSGNISSSNQVNK